MDQGERLLTSPTRCICGWGLLGNLESELGVLLGKKEAETRLGVRGLADLPSLLS